MPSQKVPNYTSTTKNIGSTGLTTDVNGVREQVEQITTFLNTALPDDYASIATPFVPGGSIAAGELKRNSENVLFFPYTDKLAPTVEPHLSTSSVQVNLLYQRIGGDVGTGARLDAVESPFVLYTPGQALRGYPTAQAAIDAAPTLTTSTLQCFAPVAGTLTLNKPVNIFANGFTLAGLTASSYTTTVRANIAGPFTVTSAAVVDFLGSVTFASEVNNAIGVLVFASGRLRFRGDILHASANTTTEALVAGLDNTSTLDFDGTITVSNKGQAVRNQDGTLVLRGRVISRDKGVRLFNGTSDVYATIDTRGSTNDAGLRSPLVVVQNASFNPAADRFTLHTGCQLLAPAGVASMHDGNPAVPPTVQVAGTLVQTAPPAATVTLDYLTLGAAGASGPWPSFTTPVSDDDANFFRATAPANYRTAEVESTINGGATVQAATESQRSGNVFSLSVGIGPLAAGQAGWRIRAGSGREAGPWLFNNVPFAAPSFVELLPNSDFSQPQTGSFLTGWEAQAQNQLNGDGEARCLNGAGSPFIRAKVINEALKGGRQYLLKANIITLAGGTFNPQYQFNDAFLNLPPFNVAGQVEQTFTTVAGADDAGANVIFYMNATGMRIDSVSLTLIP